MSDVSLWATHELRCTECDTTFPVGYGGKATALDTFGGVSEMCPTCEKYTACIDSRYDTVDEARNAV